MRRLALTPWLLCLTIDAAAAGKDPCPASGENFLAPSKHPAPAQPLPDWVGPAVAAQCPGELSLAGPFKDGPRQYAAGIGWDGGSTGARMVLLAVERDGGRVVASGEVPVGYSARYNESFAPELAGILPLPGRPPFPLLTTTSMGVGGGGGAQLILVEVHGTRLQPQRLGSIRGATDINTVVTSPECTDVLSLTRSGGLRFQGCFNGKLEPPQCFDFADGGFVPRATPSRP